MSAVLLSRAALSNLAWEYVLIHKRFLMKHWRKITRQWWSPRPRTHGELVEEIFQILLKQNLRSLRVRYGRRSEADRICSSEWHAIEPSERYRLTGLDAARLVMLCSYYNYQASETHSYPWSVAARIISSITSAAYCQIVGELVPQHERMPPGQPLPDFV